MPFKTSLVLCLSLLLFARVTGFSTIQISRAPSVVVSRGQLTRPNSVTSIRRTPWQLAGARAVDGDGDDTIPPGSSNEPVAASDGSEDDFDDEEDDFLVIPTKIPTKESLSWEIGNSFDQFLNQCTIQSFMFLLKTCRDPQTVIWIEKFTQPTIDTSRSTAMPTNATLPTGGSGKSKLLGYHGLAAMNTTAFPTWDSYFRLLLEQPQEFYIVESTQAHVPSYEMEVNPASLCSRMISVREQIAREFVKDLTVLSTMGGLTMQTYWQRVRDAAADHDSLRSGYAGSLLFLEADPGDDSDYMPSPLRKGNYDLLVLLATQESIHRVLNPAGESSHEDTVNVVNSEPMAQSDRQFLSNFYLNRLVSHFTGGQRYGRAEQFLQELLLSTPGVVTAYEEKVQEDGVASSSSSSPLVDPTRIAEQILHARQNVALEWARRAAGVAELHMEIKRVQLNLLLKSYERKDDDAFQ